MTQEFGSQEKGNGEEKHKHKHMQKGKKRGAPLNRIDLLAVVAIVLLMLILSLPGEWVVAIEAWVKSLISLPQRPPTPGWFPTDKVVHVLLFLLTSLPVTLAIRQHRPRAIQGTGLAVLIMLGIALLSEWIQSYVPGRSADPMDVLADFIGIGIGISLLVFLALNRQKRQKLTHSTRDS